MLQIIQIRAVKDSVCDRIKDYDVVNKTDWRTDRWSAAIILD